MLLWSTWFSAVLLSDGVMHVMTQRYDFSCFLRWPRELNALQKTHANRKSIRRSRKHFHHFDSRCCKCSQHNQMNSICSAFLFLVYIYMYAFSRRFYPKRLTLHSGYTCFCQYMCSLGIEPTTFALLTQCSNHWATGTLCVVLCCVVVVLWALAACVLSNWGSCFLNLHVFSAVAARWALSPTHNIFSTQLCLEIFSRNNDIFSR